MSAERGLLDASFRPLARFRPIEIVAPEFVLASSAPAVLDTEVRRAVALPAPFVGIELELPDDDGGSGVLTMGLASADGRSGVRAVVDPATGASSLELTADGVTKTVRRARRAFRPSGATTYAFALCENQVTLLGRRPGEAWAAVVTERARIVAALDFRRPDLLGALELVWGVRGGSRLLGEVRAGLFGLAGLRDPHLVQNADGTPYLRDGKAFLTWTCAGLGFFQQCHWGVFAFDPDAPTDLRQVAQLYSSRDGLVLGDTAGQLVRDGDRWLVVVSAWGDFGESTVHVRHAMSEDDLLSGVHVLETSRTPLPTEHGTWDPSLTRIGSDWIVAFVESPSQEPFDFHPALARTSAHTPFDGLSLVAAANDLHQTEGTLVVRDSERWLVLASDGDARRFPAYDLDLQPVGHLAAPYGTNIPHPQVLRRSDGTWLMVTFDGDNPFSRVLGYGAHGAVVILEEDR